MSISLTMSVSICSYWYISGNNIYIYNICLFIYIFIVIFQVYRHKQLTWCIVNADIQSTAART